MAVVVKLFLLYGILYFIGGTNASDEHCPTFMKHEALRDELLNDRAICRAQQFDYTDTICLNGFKSRGYYCSTGGCNLFGYNCDGHCLSGKDNRI